MTLWSRLGPPHLCSPKGVVHVVSHIKHGGPLASPEQGCYQDVNPTSEHPAPSEMPVSWLIHLHYGDTRAQYFYPSFLFVSQYLGVVSMGTIWHLSCMIPCDGNLLCIAGAFRSIPGLYPLDVSTTSPVVTIKSFLKAVTKVFWRQNHPRLRMTVLGWRQDSRFFIQSHDSQCGCLVLSNSHCDILRGFFVSGYNIN